MPYSNLTQLNTYEFGNKTDVDDLTTEIDNRFKSPATVTEHLATTTTPEAGVPVVYAFATPVAAGDIVLTMPARFRLTDLIVARSAAAGGASTLKAMNAGNDITNLMDINFGATVIIRVTTIDATRSRIAAGGTLVIRTAGANNAAMVTVTGYHT
tara:strand:+ start:8161 stop:8625 length:465 start_codon:yes stop_codon:yes gene_type:complete